MDFTKLRIEEFLEDLAKKEPVPGGGGASALTGATATALIEMAVNYSDVSNDNLKEDLKVLRELQEKLINLDAKNYLKLNEAFKLPKETEEEKQVRREKIELLSVKACKAPLFNMILTYSLIKIVEIIFKDLNKNLISDVGIALELSRATLHTCWLNIVVNLKNIRDVDTRTEIIMTSLRSFYNGICTSDRLYEKILKDLK